MFILVFRQFQNKIKSESCLFPGRMWVSCLWELAGTGGRRLIVSIFETSSQWLRNKVLLMYDWRRMFIFVQYFPVCVNMCVNAPNHIDRSERKFHSILHNNKRKPGQSWKLVMNFAILSGIKFKNISVILRNSDHAFHMNMDWAKMHDDDWINFVC